jgi:VanZ family protein
MVGFRNRKAAMPASLSMVLLGILLEIGQYYIPGRAFSYIDMSANGLGVLVGAALGSSVRPRLKNLLLPPEGG